MTISGHPNGRRVVDCDVRIDAATSMLMPYLSSYWQDVITTTAFKGMPAAVYGLPTSEPRIRPDVAFGSVAVHTRVEEMRTGALETDCLSRAVLTCRADVDGIHNPDAAAAMAGALNDWQAAEWLSIEPRARGSVVVPIRFPELAAGEVARLGAHPSFVQVLAPVRTALPYGNRAYAPLFDAINDCGLVFAMYDGGMPGTPPTSSGWPSYFAEEAVAIAGACQAQLMSLIVEGAFERWPRLRVAFLGAGFCWMPAFLWRLDKEWRGLRREVPWVRQPPSRYVQERVCLSLSPSDGPDDPAGLAEFVKMNDLARLLMFSGSGVDGSADWLDVEGVADVWASNAEAFYGPRLASTSCNEGVTT